jgi:hypothetical protein
MQRTLFLLAMTSLAIGCGGSTAGNADGTVADIAQLDASPQQDGSGLLDGHAGCQSCLEAPLPDPLAASIEEYPTDATDQCDGVCVLGPDGVNGACRYPDQPGVSCDHKAKGLPAETADPALASEPYALLDGSGGGSGWCSDCTCDGTTCQGIGSPFDRKKTRIYLPKGGPTRDELFVFLGGTGGNCAIHKWVSTTAAVAGYRSLCLAYINDPSSEDYCAKDSVNNPTSTCAWDFRRENLLGEDLSSELIVGPRNSVIGRLSAALQHLHGKAPTQGFDAYLDAKGRPRWDRIIIAGFSQGGGNAGILSQLHRTARAIFFSKGVSPVYTVETTPSGCKSDADCVAAGSELCVVAQGRCATAQPAAYASQPRATPLDKTFLFIHESETAMAYSPETCVAWGMDLCGGLTNVDGSQPQSWGCARMLSTKATPATTPDSYHGSMGSDGSMAKAQNGYPRNQHALLYMMIAQ